jgi:hypothetical protein
MDVDRSLVPKPGIAFTWRRQLGGLIWQWDC